MADSVSKSWFAVFNNPQDHGYPGEPHEVVDRLIDEWISGSPTRSCAMAFCVSADGLPHIHMVLEDVKAMRFTVVKKTFAVGAHFEPTKGTKEQAEDYINKKGRWQEKGEKILYASRYGEIKGCQGRRRDLEVVSELIEQGFKPDEIMDMDISYRYFESMIKGAFYSKRRKEVSFMRDVEVFYHVGESGSGKSYTACSLIQERGQNNVFFVSQYENGFLDDYMGEDILFLDEFKSSIKFGLLLSLLDKYQTPIYARYHNIYPCWTEVHITSVFPPERLYSYMVSCDEDVDTVGQLMRRISYVVYHWKENGCYRQYSLPAGQYTDYDSLKASAFGKDGFVPVSSCTVFS
ncbi:hypothetical protein AALB16_11635 [Lachnospiraceae bacterium 62-35]